jgi:methanogenic corrinoid protein MtbC1
MGDGYALATILDEVVAPIQQESGRRWQVGDYSISEEHVSTTAAEVLLATLAGAFDQPADAPHLVVACAVGDQHTLPARMAAALLLAEGYRTTFLGTSVPADDLQDYLAEAQPAGLVVACTLAANLLGARDVVDAAHRAGVPVIAGGRAFGHTDARAAAIGADAWASSLLALVNLLDAWPPEARGRETETPGTNDQLVAKRSQASEAVAAALAPDASPPRGRAARVVDEAARLFDTLVVAVQLQDSELLREHASWLANYLPTIGVQATTASDILRHLGGEVSDVDPEVRALVLEAADAAAAGLAAEQSGLEDDV